MSYFPFKPAQQPMSSSLGVVIASDQSPVSVTGTVNLAPTSVAVLQGTNPWMVNMPSPSVIAYQLAGSTLAVSGTFSGGNSSVQVVGQMPPQSVSGVGIFNINPVGNGSVIATLTNSSVTALQGTNPWIVNMPSPSVISYQLAGSVLAVSGTFSGGNSSVQVVGIVPPSSVSGVGTFNINPVGNGSIIAVLTNSSVTALQGTNPWQTIIPGSIVTVWKDSSVLAGLTSTNASVLTVSTNSSIAALQGTTPWITTMQNASIAGTYTEDSGHATGDRGLFTLGVRNDTVASFVSADSDYSPYAVDSAGRIIIKPFAPDQASVFGVGSVNGAASVILMAAPGTGLRNYLTDFTVANTGTATTLVRITAGGASLLGTTIAPAGGGSNMIGLNFPIVAPPNSPINFAVDTASSVVYGTAYGYKAP